MKRKLISFLSFLLLFVLTACCFACGEKGVVNVKKVKVTVDESAQSVAIDLAGVDVEENVSLLAVMEALQEAKKLSFEKSADGMIVDINGKKNDDASFSYWMLYTDDVQLSNSEWGTYAYGDKTLSSASFGAAQLTVKTDTVYVWAYQTMSF